MITFREYLFKEKILFCIEVAVCSYTALFLSLLNIDRATIAIAEAGLVVLFTFILLVRFFSLKGRLEQLSGIINGTEEKYLCGEILPKPANDTEVMYFELMKEISHSAVSEIEGARVREREYREYVEGFVHEIKTPLMAATLLAQNLQDEGSSRKIRHELKLADNQVENVLYMAKLDSLDKDIVLKRCELESIVSEAISEEMDLLIMAGISLEVDVTGTVTTDPVLFRMAIKQLLVNASKYCKGCRLEIKGDGQKLCISDNGPGIESSELARVVKKGFVGSEGRRNPASTGMGLYIAHSICEKLNIDMKVESVVGSYTGFTFSLPYKCVR